MTRALPALAGLVLLAGCADQPPAKRKPPVVAPPAPPATAVVVPAETDWREVPLTPGTWRYAAAAEGSSAGYGVGQASVFAIRCDAATRLVRLTVPGTAGPLTVRTSSSTRTLPPDGALAARDPFLDEIAFSRGRFSVTDVGGVTLHLPSWAEPSRVIEDCRG